MILRLYKYLSFMEVICHEKQLILFLTLGFLLTLAACGTSGPNSASDNPISIADSVTDVEITHIISGTESLWTVNSDELESLKNWILGLNYRMVSFEAGNSPGDEDGGEVYRFDIGEDHPGFSYVINGPDRYYLLMDGTWYSVSNPSDPPVTEPQWEELTLEKVKELAKKGTPCLGAILNYIVIQTSVRGYISTSTK